MNRKLFVILAVVAVALYSYVAFILAGGSLPKQVKRNSANNNTVHVDKLVLNSVLVHFENRERDPFLPYKEKPKQPAVIQEKPKKVPVVVAVKESPKPPSIRITGIMWNPTSPVAMVSMPDGASTVAKAGMTIGEVTFKKIEKNRIQVAYNGKDFWIDR